jgi:DNA-cytosine methyltransferase
VDITKKFNHISLCTGYGGIDLGLGRVIPNLRTIGFCEIELYAIQNLVAKMEKGWLQPSPVWTDLKTFPFKEFYGKVDILSGGFPCQPFSTSGKRIGDSDPRHLFPYIKQGCIDCKPAFIFLENVRGIISSTLNTEDWADPQGTPVLLHILREMERIGYTCEWGLFSARETGLPHTRHRVFILGKRNDITHSQLSTFSQYFQKDDEQIQFDETKPKIHFQVLGENDYGIEKIKSRFIAIPKYRDRFQYTYEPRRIIGGKELDNTLSIGLETTNIKDGLPPKNSEWEADSEYPPSNDGNLGLATKHEKQLSNKPTMGRNANGVANWMDYEKLFNHYTNHREEMTLLGNGVVPAMAEIAFKTLFSKMN